MNIGYFTSFTAFLALNDADFCNNYLRQAPQAEGILPLAGYLQFWGWFFAVATALIALCKHETNFQPAGEDTSIPPFFLYTEVPHSSVLITIVVVIIVVDAIVTLVTIL